MTASYSNPESEFVFKTSRSGGKGGQNVNKVSTKVELIFDIPNSRNLSIAQKVILLKSLANRITREGILHITVQSTRSQFQNKILAIAKFHELLANCFAVRKKRLATKPKKSSVEKRITGKKLLGEKKSLRRKFYP